MRIAKAILVDPGRNVAFGVCALTVSYFVFAYSTLFGQAPILVYYAFWLPLVLVDHRRFLKEVPRLWWIVPFAAFALFSTFWSAAPGASARAGVQYASHIACALIAARVISARTLTLGSLCGVALVLAYSLAVGEYHYDPIDGSYSFVGAFASKNQLGFFASLGILFAYVALVLLKERRLWAIAAAATGLLSAHSLLISQSATSVIAVTGTLALSVCVSVALALRRRTRLVVFFAGVGLALVGAYMALHLGAFDALLGAFGKDTTLTGRTYLWSQGLAAARENPVLGRGYQAYWVQGFADAERLWAEFYITARTGFHFHSTYVETLVELGGVGFVLMCVLLAAVAGGHLARLLRGHDVLMAHLMLAIGAMLLVRSFVEVDVITPYVVGSFLLYFAAGALAMRAPNHARSAPVARRGRAGAGGGYGAPAEQPAVLR